MPISRVFSKWLFWLKSKNRHGVHSPFIYGFLDKGLYGAHLEKSPVQTKLLRASLEYFKPDRVGVAGTPPPDSPLGQLLMKETLCAHPPYDFFIFETPSESVDTFLSDRGNWHNDSIVYIGNLRVSPSGYKRWGEIKAHPSVRVVLETYWGGLLLFRREQAREHFRIRT